MSYVFLGVSVTGNVLPSRTGGSFFIFPGLVRELWIFTAVRSMASVQRQNVARTAGRIFEIDMRQAFPAAPDTDHLTIELAARYTTVLMTEFNPGTSPPPVRIPMRF